ncbi:MAG: DNA primase, partial [Clostridia bacterium]|nr:DNA primase [Clostridia bacterium]
DLKIPREVVEEIIRRNDIEQVIGSYVTLKHAGSNMVGLCPFHSENSPSFTVFGSDDHFYCFGCGTGGDVITFIMKMENVDYPTALEMLAKRAGIEIPQTADNSYGERGVKRERVLKMNEAAARFFRHCLTKEPCGEEARQYFKKRGISEGTSKQFYLGYAPNDFGKLTNYLKSLGFTEEEMVAGFLCGKSQKTGRAYDYFRNRVIFPIVDTSRNIVAFGGRVMDDSKPKYLNSSDTPAFKKSKNLFALNYAKGFCAEQLILCEGYMDVIALHQAGFPNAVATLGTAITEEHARIISRYTKKVIISYDSDEAGQKAANKAMLLLGKVGVEVRVLKMQGAKDPDEFIKKKGAEAFKSLLTESRTGFEYKLEAVLSKHDISQVEEKRRAAEEISAVISDYHSTVERELYSKRAGEALSLSADAIRTDAERLRKKKIREFNKDQTKEAHASLRQYSNKINPDAAKNLRAAYAEETLLGLLMIYPEYREGIIRGEYELLPDDFFTEFGKRAFSAIIELEASGGFIYSLLGETFNPDEMSALEDMQLRRRSLAENGPEVFRSSAQILRSETKKAIDAQSGNYTLEDKLAEKRRRLEEERKRRGE